MASSRYILTPSGEWVGPPALVLSLRLGPKDEVLDGRKRLKEHSARGLKTPIPKIVAKSHIEAIRHLILAGHHERAANYAERFYPQVKEQTAKALAFFLDLPSHHLVLGFKRALKDPKERHKLPRRAMSVVRQVKRIRNRMLEGEEITLTDIESALGEFLDD